VLVPARPLLSISASNEERWCSSIHFPLAQRSEVAMKTALPLPQVRTSRLATVRVSLPATLVAPARRVSFLQALLRALAVCAA
jgi:hypothetical protein